jgi:hypothetical protein
MKTKIPFSLAGVDCFLVIGGRQHKHTLETIEVNEQARTGIVRTYLVSRNRATLQSERTAEVWEVLLEVDRLEAQRKEEAEAAHRAFFAPAKVTHCQPLPGLKIKGKIDLSPFEKAWRNKWPETK